VVLEEGDRLVLQAGGLSRSSRGGARLFTCTIPAVSFPRGVSDCLHGPYRRLPSILNRILNPGLGFWGLGFRVHEP
jgi:hypothetical protein